MDIKHRCGKEQMDEFVLNKNNNTPEGTAFIQCRGCEGIVGTVNDPEILSRIEQKLDKLLMILEHPHE